MVLSIEEIDDTNSPPTTTTTTTKMLENGRRNMYIYLFMYSFPDNLYTQDKFY